MNRKQILTHLNKAVENDTPDTLEDILLHCEQIDCAQQKGYNMSTTITTPDTPIISDSLKRGQNQKTKRSLIKWASTAAAVLAIVFGTWFGYGHYSVDSIIDLDVNPSVELKINRAEKILSATPLNAEAEEILDGMDLKNVDLDIAVNALIGSMLKNGYVSDMKNSILISVENPNAQKSAELQQRLSSDVSNLLEANSVGGAVVSQTISEDEQLKALAEKYNISLGKAALVQLLVSQDARFQFADLAALPINDITLLLSSRQNEIEGVSMSGQASSSAYIGESKAKAIALEHAGLSESSVTFVKAKLDFDDGRMVYEVEFYTSSTEYEYELDAATGQIITYDIDKEQNNSSPAGGGNTASYIGEAKAKSIALNHAGLSESSVTFTKTKLDSDDGRVVYDVEFYSGNVEYDYEIDASSGNILKYDRETEEHSSSKSHSGGDSSSSSSSKTTTPTTSSSFIGEAKAKSIALNHAGLTESKVSRLKVKLDKDDGRSVYDVEFYSENIEYDYEIDASGGQILKADSDVDD